MDEGFWRMQNGGLAEIVQVRDRCSAGFIQGKDPEIWTGCCWFEDVCCADYRCEDEFDLVDFLGTEKPA